MASAEIWFSAVGNDKLQGMISWSSTSNGAVANTSTVNAILYAKRPDGFGPSYGTTWSGYVQIGNERQDIQSGYREIDDDYWTEMARISNVVIAHNDNGTGSVTISGSVKGPSNTSLANLTSSGSQTVQLDTIARYFTQKPTITLTSKTETSFTLTWNTSENCSSIDIYVGGSKYNTYPINPAAKTGTITISSRSANTTYAVYGKFTRSDSGLITDSNSSNWTTYSYPYVSGVSVSNLKIGNQQTISLYNPLGRSVAVYMKQNSTSGTTLYSQNSATSGTSYSFTPTANTLYSSIPNSQSGNAVYYCTYSSQTVSTKSGIYSVIGTEIPTFSNYTAEDVNSTTTALTGNSSIVVKDYSNVQVTISTSNKASANNSASMKNYKIQIGTMTPITKDYSASADVTATQNNANSGSVSVSAIDSRGLVKTVTKSLTLKNYFKPYITELSATRDDYGTSKLVTLSFKINFWNESFGSGHNALRNITYKYKVSGDPTWVTGATSLSATTSGNVATVSAQINGDLGAEGFTLGTAFDIQVYTNDALDSVTATTTLLSGTPAIAITGDRVAIGGPVESSNIYDIQLHKGTYIKGNVSITGTLNANVKQLANYYDSRPSSANLTADGSGGLKTFKATSSMTTGKPPADAHIIHLNWDNTGGYDSQIAVKNGDAPRLWVRGMEGGVWGSWTEFLKGSDSGWTAITISNSKWTNFSWEPLAYRLIGNVCYIHGGGTLKISELGSNKTICSLPYRPRQNFVTVQGINLSGQTASLFVDRNQSFTFVGTSDNRNTAEILVNFCYVID